MTWAKGQDIIDELVGLRRLQRVTASRESALERRWRPSLRHKAFERQRLGAT
ncbi:hypothetical protein C8E84_3229 [Ornithinibacter aureus]|nr:hypothetical protein C8E84_3229 [Ornithinibacter aureus]